MLANDGTLANLSPETQRRYAALWRAHVHPRLGDPDLRRLRPEAVDRFRIGLLDDGVSPKSIEEAIGVLNSVFSESAPVIVGGDDPVQSGPLRAFEPREVERLRAGLGARDGVIVSLLAYAGLRPGELLGLRWGDLTPGWLRVDGRNQAVRPHTSVKGVRQVRLLRPLAADLAGWRDASDVRPERPIIPSPGGAPWAESDWSAWRRDVFVPTALAAGLPPGTRPYDLRHTFAWLLLREGGSVADLARETGYSPLTALRIYRGLADRAQAAGHRLAPEAIAVARAA